MKKIYFFLLPLIAFCSCATRVDYIGNTYEPSRQIDVFVMKNAVQIPYEVIGKGYVRMASAFSSYEKIQKKAVDKAKKKGAHAVIVEDYFVLQTDSNISTNLRMDSTNHSIGLGSAQVHPSVGSGFQILFIRYK